MLRRRINKDYTCRWKVKTNGQAMSALNAGKILFAHDGYTNVCNFVDHTTKNGHNVFIFYGVFANGNGYTMNLYDDDEWRTE